MVQLSLKRRGNTVESDAWREEGHVHPGMGGLVAISADNPSLSLCFPICKLGDNKSNYKIIVKSQLDNAGKICTNHDSNHYYCDFTPRRVEVAPAPSEIHFSSLSLVRSIPR